MLTEGLELCCFSQQPTQLKIVVDKKRHGLASLHPVQLAANKYFVHC